jgi:hypothetical protein
MVARLANGVFARRGDLIGANHECAWVQLADTGGFFTRQTQAELGRSLSGTWGFVNVRRLTGERQAQTR